jgi:hypothetical protein
MARNFNGGTDRIIYSNGWNDGGSAGWFCFWMRTSQVTTDVCLPAVWGSTSRSGWGFLLNNTANKVSFHGYAVSSPEKIALASTTSVNDGNWHHVCANWNTANGGANALYVDGVSEASGNSSASWAITNAHNLYLGDNQDTFWASYVGDLAEVGGAIGYQLSAGEIAAMAKGFSTRTAALRDPGPFLAPLVRETHNLGDPGFGGITGTTIVDHPRLIGGVI